MKTKITYKSGADVLRLDDTDHESFPVEGEKIELNGVDYKVKSVESAVVILEPIPEDEEIESPTRAQSRTRTSQRIKAERRSNAPRGAVQASRPTRTIATNDSSTKSTRVTAARRAASNANAHRVHSTTSKHVAVPAKSSSKAKR